MYVRHIFIYHLTMNQKVPMKRTGVFLPEALIASLQAVADEEGISFAEALRNIAEVGLVTRQGTVTHQSRMYQAIENLELAHKALEERLVRVEAALQEASS